MRSNREELLERTANALAQLEGRGGRRDVPDAAPREIATPRVLCGRPSPQQAAAAKARTKYLDELATRQEAAWKRAEALIEEKKAKAYDEAVSLLVDLRDVAKRANTVDTFSARLATLLGRYSSRRALLERATRSGLIRP